MARKLTLGTCYRAAKVDKSTIDEEARTVSLSFSSEFPVERHFGTEILDHHPDSVRLDRLRNGGPLLMDHNPESLVGVVESAEIKDKRGQATVRFSKSPQGQIVFDEVKDGIRRNVSVGYRIHDMIREGKPEGPEVFRVTDYEPLEISMVGVPADPTVGMDRSYEIELKERNSHMSEPNKDTPTPTPTPTPAPDLEGIKAQAKLELIAEQRVASDRKAKRDTEINAIAELHNNDALRTMAVEFVKTDGELDEFRQAALKELARDTTPLSVIPSEGMSQRDLKQYSFTRAIMSCLPKQFGGDGSLGGFEREMSDEVAKRTGRNPDGFFIPEDVLQKRVLEVGTFTGAGALVQSSDGGQSLIELLRNNMAVVEMGATTLSGLTGDVDIPRQTGGGTASWLAEGATLTRADQTVGQLALRPHRLSAATAFSKQLLAQASPDVEGFVRNDLMQVIAIAKDLACLSGSGASGQPLGIINTSNLSTAATHTASGTFTWPQAMDYEQNLDDNNAVGGSLGYLMYPTAKAVARTTVKDSGGGGFVWDSSGNTIGGHKAMSTNQLSSGAGGVVFGNWADLIVADWDGTDVIVDPFTLSLNGQVSIVIQTLTDCGVRNPVSFCISAA